MLRVLVNVPYARGFHTHAARGLPCGVCQRAARRNNLENFAARRRSMSMFCAAPQPHHRLAVLGVFTAEENVARRAAARTWVSETDASSRKPLLARFVARGIGHTPTLSQEARAHGDVVFLAGPAEMPRSNGPLLTLILWLECALVAWPHAALIGKADDDVWVHVDATAAHLQGSLGALRGPLGVESSSVPYMYWGLMETYSWSLTSHRPMGFQYKYGSGHPACTMQNKSNHTLVGPVHFAKGPMYFISAPLVAQLVADPSVRDYAMTVIASANFTTRHRVLPWEDVVRARSPKLSRRSTAVCLTLAPAHRTA